MRGERFWGKALFKKARSSFFVWIVGFFLSAGGILGILYGEEGQTVAPIAPPIPGTIEQIDKELVELRELQEKYRASAQKNGNDAMRWQFQNENYLDARKAWEAVAEDKRKIQEIQDRIDVLEKRKRELTDTTLPPP